MKTLKLLGLSTLVALAFTACGDEDFSSKQYAVKELVDNPELFDKIDKFCDEYREKRHIVLTEIQLQNCRTISLIHNKGLRK